MKPHPIELLIQKADTAISQEDFETLLGVYSEDAILVVQPGVNACGKEQLRKAFEAIAEHFKHTLHVHQNGMKILEAGDTALVLAKTIISAAGLPETERKATYVFTKGPSGEWLCTIDNSYGHALLADGDA